jgi:hypothetical protein
MHIARQLIRRAVLRLYLCWLIITTCGLQVPLLSGSYPAVVRLPPSCTRGCRKNTLIRLGPWTSVKEMLVAATHCALPVPHAVVKCVRRDAGTLCTSHRVSAHFIFLSSAMIILTLVKIWVGCGNDHTSCSVQLGERQSCPACSSRSRPFKTFRNSTAAEFV